MKILLVEDDAGVGRVVCNGLRANGFDVDWIRGGVAVLGQVRSSSYSVIVLDLMLPDADGYEVCRKLRDVGVSTPVCMLTARDSLDDKLSGFRAGADDYLTKPFSIDELVARLRVMARRDAAASSGTCVQYSGLEIDLPSREVRMQGVQIDLTPREFDVLVLFAQNPGKVITRERLLQVAWSDTEAITPNATDVYIGYLRRKMKAASAAPAIETVRGVGFKLV